MNNRTLFILNMVSAVLLVVLLVNNYLENGFALWQQLIIGAVLFVVVSVCAIVYFVRYKKEGSNGVPNAGENPPEPQTIAPDDTVESLTEPEAAVPGTAENPPSES